MPMTLGGGANNIGSSQITDGAIANADINNAAAIARSKLANISAGNRLVGRKTNSAGAEEEIAMTDFTETILDDADAATMRATLGAAVSGANADITSIAGLTTPLAESQGGTGAAGMLEKAIGALGSLYVKLYFNVQLLFILWTGDTDNALTTPFDNWIRNSTDITVLPGGAGIRFGGTSFDAIWLNSGLPGIETESLQFDDTDTVILDFWAKLPASGTGDINMGFGYTIDSFPKAYNFNDASDDSNRIVFSQRGSTGVLYATIGKKSVGITNTDISAGITITNWNNYRIELDLSSNAKFYVNGVLKATLSGANLTTEPTAVGIGFGRSDTSLFAVNAPNVSIQMNG